MKYFRNSIFVILIDKKKLNFLYDDVLRARQLVIDSMDLNVDQDIENLLSNNFI